MVAADGRERWVHLSVNLNELAWGATELSGVMVDITDRKRVEEASRKLALHTLKQSETEHRWLSQELDSGIGLHLAALKVSLASLQQTNLPSGTETQQKLQDCIQLVQTCIDDMCSMSLMLRPPFLDERGLLAALRWYTQIFSRWSGMEIDMDIPEDMGRLNPANEIVLFRFAQECLRNVYRHSGANHSVLRLREAANEFVMEIEDTGFGIPADVLELLENGGYTRGIGLTKLRERVRELEGTMQIHTGTMGTIICARIPRAEKPVPPEADQRTTFPLRP
jgi:signal transduction histidine kinase